MAILTKMVNWQKHSSPFHKGHLLVTNFCQKLDKFSPDSPFSLNLAYKRVSFVISYQYFPNPWQISARFTFVEFVTLQGVHLDI